MATRYSSVFQTQLDTMVAVWDAQSRIHGLMFQNGRPIEQLLTPFAPTTDAPLMNTLELELSEYFAGKRFKFSLKPVLEGPEFHRTVWRALLEIPYGQTASYGEVARRLGKPGAAQAVGAANGANPVSIIVPCHRVIGADGSLIGFGGGLQTKRALLALEMSRAPARTGAQPSLPF